MSVTYSNPILVPFNVGDAQAGNTVIVPGNMVHESGVLRAARVTGVSGIAGATPAEFVLSFGDGTTVDLFGTFTVTADNVLDMTAGENLIGELDLTVPNYRNDDELPVTLTCAAPAAAAANVTIMVAYY